MALRYSNMKVFHFPDYLKELPESCSRIRPPIHIRLKPTNVCNHNCWYCSYRRDRIQLGKDMVLTDYIPREKMKALVADFADMKVQAVTFSGGGEPLCYPYLNETLLGLAHAAIKFACLTNGTGLHGETADIMAHHGSWLRVSIDGWDGPSYAAYRRTSPDAFSNVMKNMKTFKRLGGKCYLGTVMVVDDKNCHHIYELIRQIRAVGADSVKIAPCIVSNLSAETNAYHQAHAVTVRDQVARARVDFADTDFEIFDAYHQQLETFDKTYQWCPFAQLNPVIGADQNVYACHDKAYNLDNGLLFSCREKGFKAAWFEDKSAFFRIRPQVDCRHHCMAHHKNEMILEYLHVDPKHLEFV